MNLSGNKIKNSYKALLTFPGATGMTTDPTVLKQMGDGGGNNTPLYLSTTQVGVRNDGLVVTQDITKGLYISNNTAATLAVPVQISPANYHVGSAWKSDATAASRQVGFRTYTVPVTGAAAVTGYYALESSVDGALASWSTVLAATTGGNIVIGTGAATALGASARLSLKGAAASDIVYFQTSGGTLGFQVDSGGEASAIVLSGSTYVSTGGLRMYGSGNNLLLINGSYDNFGLLQFGGTAATEPALKRSTTYLQGRLANDSAFCFLQAKLATDTNAVTGIVNATVLASLVNTIKMFDATGTAYYVPCSETQP